MVTILVLAEYGKKSVVAFLTDGVLFRLFREVEVELDKREKGNAPKCRCDTSLFKKVVKPSVEKEEYLRLSKS